MFLEFFLMDKKIIEKDPANLLKILLYFVYNNTVYEELNSRVGEILLKVQRYLFDPKIGSKLSQLVI